MSDHVSNLHDVVQSASDELGRMLDAASYTRDGIAPTEGAEAYGRRTHIVAEDAPQGPPIPDRYVFTGQALHPFVSAFSPLLVGRCRHCWGKREQHVY